MVTTSHTHTHTHTHNRKHRRRCERWTGACVGERNNEKSDVTIDATVQLNFVTQQCQDTVFISLVTPVCYTRLQCAKLTVRRQLCLQSY
jgi:hypothetical protein